MKTNRFLHLLSAACLGAPLWFFGLASAAPVEPPPQTPLEDSSDKANPDSTPVEDTDDQRAGSDATPVEDSTDPAGKETEPVEDSSDNANPDSTKVEDDTRGATGRTERTTRQSSRAEREARRQQRHEKRDAEERNKPGKTSTDQPEREKEADEGQDLAPAPADPAADKEVQEATESVGRKFRERKTEIRGREEAQQVIEDILGKDSEISRAEIRREERRPQRQARRERNAEPAQRKEAITYFERRLRGEAVETPPPALLSRSEARRGSRIDEHDVEMRRERHTYRPRYFNEGRRYVYFDSRASIPTILVAAQALNQVQLQPVREVIPIFEKQNVSGPVTLPPDYRDENAVAVSYAVDEKSMITSDDILFLQGSTQFADPYSYDIVTALGDAMKSLPEEERFVIEGHASAEGSYEDNMTLSQQRAERIVREMVRRGVSPTRLLPVGYGESEARNPEDAPETQRAEDRRVIVFRLQEEPVASR